MDLRTMAVSRLMLDNIPHMKAYWIMLGIGTAQVALSYGADDIDGTVRHELIYHDAGATTPEILSVDAIRRLIIEAGREPVERDTLYHRINRDGAHWQTGAAITAGARRTNGRLRAWSKPAAQARAALLATPGAMLTRSSMP